MGDSLCTCKEAQQQFFWAVFQKNSANLQNFPSLRINIGRDGYHQSAFSLFLRSYCHSWGSSIPSVLETSLCRTAVLCSYGLDSALCFFSQDKQSKYANLWVFWMVFCFYLLKGKTFYRLLDGDVPFKRYKFVWCIFCSSLSYSKSK